MKSHTRKGRELPFITRVSGQFYCSTKYPFIKTRRYQEQREKIRCDLFVGRGFEPLTFGSCARRYIPSCDHDPIVIMDMMGGCHISPFS